MRKIQQTLVFSVLFLPLAFFAGRSVAAQQIPPSYGFLEVVDYKNAPVADASVRFLNRGVYTDPLSLESAQVMEKTDQKGLLERGIRVRLGEAESPFAIDKPGFYPFIDYFGLFGFLNRGWRNNKNEPLKLELLVIPKTRAEKRAIGNEQQKREFFGAARRGDRAAVRLFLKSGLSPNLTTSALRGVPAGKEIPVIVFAARSGNAETVKEFLAAGVDVRQDSEPLRDILNIYLAAYPYPFDYAATEAGKKEMLKAYENGAEGLIDAGARLNPGLLAFAAGKGYAGIVGKMLTKGVPVNERDNSGRTALLAAIYYEQTEIVKFLLAKGADPNLPDNDDRRGGSYYNPCTSALMHAVSREDAALVDLLLAKGADPNLTCKSGRTALRVALERKRYEIFDRLVAAGADAKAVDASGETNLMFAARLNDLTAVKKILEMGVPVDARNKEGSTALTIAARDAGRGAGRFKINLLLDSGADPNAVNEQPLTNWEGRQSRRCETALMNAAENADGDVGGNVPRPIIDELIARGANVNFTCQNGQSALLRAVYAGQATGVKKLLDAGADVTGERGRAALDYARKSSLSEYHKSRFEEIVKMLEARVAP